MKKYVYLITMGICTISSQFAFAEGAGFPAARPIASPNMLWEIRSEQGKKHEGAYSLILRNRKTGMERKIFSCKRWCEVLWSAHDSQIAITDWLESNTSELLLFRTGQKGDAISIDDEAARAYLTKEEMVGHRYWEALKWEKDRRLRIRAFGHTDDEPLHEFMYEFIFDPIKKSATLVKKESGPRSQAEQKIWASKEKH